MAAIVTTGQTRIKSVIAIASVLILLVMSLYWYSTLFNRVRGPDNPITENFSGDQLAGAQAKFVGNGIDAYDTLKDRRDHPDIKHAKGESFIIPLDIWLKIEPIARKAQFTTTLRAEVQDYDDLIEVSLESKNGEILQIQIKGIVENCSCFAFHVGPSIFFYENVNRTITVEYLSNVAVHVISSFQNGDTESARERVQRDLATFGKLADEIQGAGANKGAF